MALIPTPTEMIARARADLRMGLPILLVRGPDRWLVAAAETLSGDRLTQILSLGAPVLAITAWRAKTLKARAYDDDLARLVLPHKVTASWIASVADPVDDLSAPMKGPFQTRREGDATPHRLALALVKSARLLPAALVLDAAPENHALTRLDLDTLAALMSQAESLTDIVAGRVPMALAGAGRVHVFRPEDGADEHYAIEIGRPDRDRPVLARLHSACFTGDVLGSLKCDCGPQLHAALAAMGAEGAGLLLYLNQEGRGIGLANKLRAYALQDQGFDTVEANHRLGFEDDERDFRLGATLLRNLGFSAVRLMTNNPAKVAMMRKMGVDVTETVPLAVGKNPLNTDYLGTKARKSGHLL